MTPLEITLLILLATILAFVSGKIPFAVISSGIILALNMPVGMPLWIAVVGAFVAIIITKQLFGGLGYNFANPALVGRIVLFLSFSKTMTAWVFPDAVSSATPLAQLAAGQKPELLTLLLGSHGGCIGETCALALLLGGAYLLVRGVITWQTPVCFVGTVFQFLIQSRKVLLCSALIAKGLDNLLAVVHFFNISIYFSQCFLLFYKVFTTF